MRPRSWVVPFGVVLCTAMLSLGPTAAHADAMDAGGDAAADGGDAGQADADTGGIKATTTPDRFACDVGAGGRVGSSATTPGWGLAAIAVGHAWSRRRRQGIVRAGGGR